MTDRTALPLHTSKKIAFFYGYVVVFASLIIIMLTFGINYTFGVFLGPLTGEYGSRPQGGEYER